MQTEENAGENTVGIVEKAVDRPDKCGYNKTDHRQKPESGRGRMPGVSERRVIIGCGNVLQGRLRSVINLARRRTGSEEPALSGFLCLGKRAVG